MILAMIVIMFIDYQNSRPQMTTMPSNRTLLLYSDINPFHATVLNPLETSEKVLLKRDQWHEMSYVRGVFAFSCHLISEKKLYHRS